MKSRLMYESEIKREVSLAGTEIYAKIDELREEGKCTLSHQ